MNFMHFKVRLVKQEENTGKITIQATLIDNLE